MCQFITATGGRIRDDHALRQLAKRSLLKWVPIDNPSVSSGLLLPDEHYFSTCRKMCDCGTELGCRAGAAQRALSVETDEPRDIKKFRKRGWSEARIARWLEETRASRERSRERNFRHTHGPWPEIDRWIEFIQAVIENRTADWVGIFVHSYHGGVETEKLPIQPARWVSRSELTPEFLMEIEEDVLYRFGVARTF